MEVNYEFCSNRRHTNGLVAWSVLRDLSSPSVRQVNLQCKKQISSIESYTAAGSRKTHLDPQHHLQAASRAFHANKWILCDKGVSVLHRRRYFEKVIFPVACPGAAHRAIHKDDLAKLDVEYRRLMRMIVGPLAHTNWASPWHEILNGWNNKV